MNKEDKNNLIVRYATWLAEKKVKVPGSREYISKDEKKIIEDKCAKNPDLLIYINFLTDSYLQLHHDLDQSELGNITLTPEKMSAKSRRKHISQIKNWFDYPFVRYPAVAVVILILAISSLKVIGSLTKPPYWGLVDKSLKIELPVSRGVSSYLEIGKANYNQKHYSQAIMNFRNAIVHCKITGEQQMQAEATCYLGLSYLTSAKFDIMGLFPGYRTTHLDSSVKYLELAKGINIKSSAINQQLDFYLGLTHLAYYFQENKNTHYDKATCYLKNLIDKQSVYTEEAKALLNVLKAARKTH